jgi:hypothetical protein
LISRVGNGSVTIDREVFVRLTMRQSSMEMYDILRTHEELE